MELDETLGPPPSLKSMKTKPPPSLLPTQSLTSLDSKTPFTPTPSAYNEKDAKQCLALWRRLVLDLLRSTACYALMPDSGKVVVFNSCLTLKHAFRALSEHDIKCAPVWGSDGNIGQDGSANSDFIGFMTVTDFAGQFSAHICD